TAPAPSLFRLLSSDAAPPSQLHTLSLHDALPIYGRPDATDEQIIAAAQAARADHFINQLPHGYDTEISLDAAAISAGERQLLTRSEEHTSELQSRFDLVCRLLLEKKKQYHKKKHE